VWYLPEWLLTNPGLGKDAARRRLVRENWDEFAECLLTYLDYAKRKYHWEPDYFSFNEPEIGVKILFDAEEHREMNKFLGEKLHARGAKTKLLLGDTASARNAESYWAPTLADPAARKYIGALAYHTWDNPSAALLRRLASRARAEQLPLFLTEVGADASAWTDGSFREWDYALKELALYMKLFREAAPTTLLQWQFSNDYALVEAAGKTITPTRRYYFIKQFCNWTPLPAVACAVATNVEAVQAAAFLALAADKTAAANTAPAVVLHLANFGAAREARLVGIPRRLNQVTGVVSGYEDAYRYVDELRVENGAVQLNLPTHSLTTLRFE
jgi:hypothetical protein